MLIYQVSLLIEIILNSFIYNNLNIDLVLKMSDNNTGDNIPRNSDNNDLPRLIRYLSANIAALAARKPLNRAIGLTIANAGNIIADVLSNEERANYWIDQYNFYRNNGRFRGGQSGSGPFERGTNPFDKPEDIGNSDTSTSNLITNFDSIKDLFSPVEHSIPLDTLINVHFVMILGLFILVFCLIISIIYLFINILILFNKDYFLNKVQNKYALMYVKYVIFKSRVDIVVMGIFIIAVLCFMLYILHYLIVHPIIVNT